MTNVECCEMGRRPLMKGEARRGGEGVGAADEWRGEPLQGSHCNACSRVRVQDTG